MASGLGVRPMASCQLHATWAMYNAGSALNADFYAHLDALADIGFECVRMDLSWSESQPTAGTLPTASTQVIMRVKAALDALQARGMKAFLTPWRAPNWSHPNHLPPPPPSWTGVTSWSQVHSSGTVPPVIAYADRPDGWDHTDVNTYPDSSHIVAYQAWVTRIADLFGGHPALIGLEIWNEPDLDDMSFAGNDNATAYAPILRAAYDAVKASDYPDTKVVFGGPVAADWRFMENVVNAIEAATGGQTKYDILAFHPYQGNWKHKFDSYDYAGVSRDSGGAWTQFRSAGGINGVTYTGTAYVPDSTSPNSIMGLRRRHGDTRPMWATEWGTSRAIDDDGSSSSIAKQRSVTTAGVPGTWPTVDAKWAAYYVAAFQWLQDNNADVTLLNVYTAYRPTSPAAGGSLSTDGMRILNANGSLTAAGTALKTYFAANPTYRDPFGDTAPSGDLPVFRTATTTTNDSTGTTTTGSLAGISNGDFMVAEFISSDTVTGSALTSVPAGWTELRPHTSNGSSMSSWFGYRFKQAGDTNPVWTLAAARDTQVVIAAYSGVDPNTPFDSVQFVARPSTSSVTTTAAPAVTTAGPNRMVLRMYGEKSSTATSVTDPAGTTRRAAVFGAGASSTSALAVDSAAANAGTVAAATATWNTASANSISMTMAIAPSATISGEATLSATSSLTVAGTRVVTGSASLSATSSLTASGTTASAINALSGVSSLTVTGAKTTFGTAQLSASASLTVTGIQTRPTTGGEVGAGGAGADGTTASRIFVPGLCRVFLGQVGTTAPTRPAALYDDHLVEVGFFTRDSLRFTVRSTFEAVKAHQSDRPTLDIETDVEEVLEVDLQEWSGMNFQAAYAGGSVTETEPGIWQFIPPGFGSERQPVMCVVRCTDGDRNYALIIPKCVQLTAVDHDLSADSESRLPLRLAVRELEGYAPYWWISDDDEAWRPATLSALLTYPGTDVYPGETVFPSAGA